jgi:hypothetical protein
LFAFVEQAAGAGHFQLDKVLNWRMTGQDAVGFYELKPRQFELRGQLIRFSQRADEHA